MKIEEIKNLLAIIYFSFFGKTFGRGYERTKISFIKKKILDNKIKNYSNNYFDERVIEIPWIVDELKKCEGNLLDVGSTLNFDYILKSISNIKKIFINTLYPEKKNFNNKSINYLYEDICNNSLKEKYFDNISCISTLEHIGFDNSHYNYKNKTKEKKKVDELKYLKALKEIKKLLKTRSKLFITVPYGKKKIYKNLQQFGKADLSRISRIFKNFKKSFIFYKFIDKTWILSSEKECRNIGPIVKKSDNRFVLSAKSIVLIKFYN